MVAEALPRRPPWSQPPDCHRNPARPSRAVRIAVLLRDANPEAVRPRPTRPVEPVGITPAPVGRSGAERAERPPLPAVEELELHQLSGGREEPAAQLAREGDCLPIDHVPAIGFDRARRAD